MKFLSLRWCIDKKITVIEDWNLSFYQGLTVLEICSSGYLSYDILCWLKHTCLIYKKMNVYWFLPFNKRFSSTMMKVIYLFGLIAQVYFVQCRREDKVCRDNLKFCIIPVFLFLWDKIFTFFSQYPFFKLSVFPMIFALEEAKMVHVIQRMFESKFLNKIHSKW